MVMRNFMKRAVLMLIGILALYLQNCEIQFGELEDPSDAAPNVRVLVVDTSNLDDLSDAMQEAPLNDQVRQNLVVMEKGVDNSLDDEQETYLKTVVDTLANDTLSVDFWQKSVRVENNKLVFSPQLEEILDIAEDRWTSLPFQAGLPIITSLEDLNNGLGKANTYYDELATNPYCFALSFNLEQLLVYIESTAVCPDVNFENCVDQLKSALVSTTDNICTALSRYYELCQAEDSVLRPETCSMILTVSVVYAARQLWMISTANLTACEVLCDPDCDDGNPCTKDYWDMERNECVHERIPNCHDQGGG